MGNSSVIIRSGHYLITALRGGELVACFNQQISQIADAPISSVLLRHKTSATTLKWSEKEIKNIRKILNLTQRVLPGESSILEKYN